jgi:Big-like domain-containing protein/HYR domain-containing protein
VNCLRKIARKKENGITDPSGNKKRAIEMDVALVTGGILSLALLLVLPNQAIVHAAPFDQAKITISPTSGPAGTEVTVKGEHFAPFSTISIRFDGDSVDTSPDNISVKKDGKFNAKFIVPDLDTDEDDEKTVRATDNSIFRNSASKSFDLKETEGSSNQEEAKITISPTSGPAGTEVTVKGEHFAPFSTISIRFDGDSVDTSPENISVWDDGKFSAKIIVPGSESDAGEKSIVARDDSELRNSASWIFEMTGGGGSNGEEADIKISPTSGPSGTEITVDGEFFAPFSTISITFDGDSVSTSPETISASDDGRFSAKFIVPDSITEDGAIAIRATDDSPSANSASDSFEVTGNGGSNEEPTREPNRDAEARSQSVTVNEDNSISIVLRASHLDENDQFSIRDNPLHGSLSGFDSEAGTLTYAPNADYSGTDRFTFRVSGSSDLGTVSITVREVNDRPIARDVQVTTLEESALQFTLLGSDVDVGDVLTFSILGVPTHGTLSGTAPNLTYLPNKDFDGYDSFRFRTSDGESSSEVANVAIRVNGVNDPPVVEAQTKIAIKENDDVRITLMATDIDSQTITFSIISGPEYGGLGRPMTTSPSVAMATYTPMSGYNGQDSFTFSVNDGSQENGISNTGTVIIVVGDSANISDESVGDTNIAESPEPSSSNEQSGSIPDTVKSGEINNPTIEGAEAGENNRVPLISFGHDIIPPSLNVPSRSIILDASSFIGATVSYESSAHDNLDGPIAIHCYPRSGLVFPVGESVVKCDATDKAGNISERSFAVIVKPFKFDNNSLFQLYVIVAAVGVGVAAILMVIRKRRHNLLVKENYESTKLILLNVYHTVKVACLRR